MMIIPNSRFQQEAEQTEAVKKPEKAEENKAEVDAKKTGSSGEAQKAENILGRRKAFDQYMPEKEGEEKSYGHYEVVPDGEGHSKVQFDNPDKGLKEKAATAADQVQEKSDSILNQGQKLQKLKKKKQQLKQKINSETDPGKAEELKRKLACIEREIKAERI